MKKNNVLNIKNKLFKASAFTLAELLAVIAIIALIATIAIPVVNIVIENSKKEMFKDNAKALIRQALYEKISDDSLDLTQINTENMHELLDKPSDNYASIMFEDYDDEILIKVIGANKWEGLAVCGTNATLKVTEDNCELDSEAPTIVYSPNGSTSYTKSGNVKITVTDELLNKTSLKYVWTTTINTPNDEEYINTFTNRGNIPMPKSTGRFYLHIIAKDFRNNISREVREFLIDIEAPIITMNGQSIVTINRGEVYTDAGATALDNVDGNLTGEMVITGTINPNVLGTYTITYNVSDSAGNTATPAVRTVNVIDETPPNVAFGTNGNSTYAKSRSTTVTVSDVHSSVDTSSLKYQWTTSTSQPTEASFTSSFTNGGTLNNPAGVTGGYYLWILAKDTPGNTKISRSNVFNLDNTAPVITMNGSNPITIDKGSVYTDAGATASDANSGIAGSVVATGTVNVSILGTYYIYYNVSDNAGNTAVQKTRTVNVVDNIAPVIAVNPASITIAMNDVYNLAGITASDNIDGDVTTSIIGTGNLNLSVPGTYTMTYNVSDSSGNNATPKSRTITVLNMQSSCFTMNTSTGSITNYNSCGASVTIPSVVNDKIVTEIGNFAFAGKNLTSVTIPDTVTTIVGSAFQNNNITSVTIPNSVTNLGGHAFYDNNLTSVSIPSSVTTIQSNTFYSNQLTSVTIPSSVTTIGTNAFRNNKIATLTIPNSVTKIEDYAFSDNLITNLTLPNSITSMGRNSFANNQLPDAQAFIYKRNANGTIDNTTLVGYGGAKKAGVVIPSNVIIIDSYALNLNGLTSVTIPSTVTTIRNYAFSENSLTSVTMQNGVTTIGSYAFASNLLTSLTIPTSVTTLSAGAFNNNQLPDAQAFIYKRNSDGTTDNTAVVGYGGAKKAGVVIPSNVIVIETSAFADCKLTSITIPNSVTTIKGSAFESNLLTAIAIPNSVTTIGAFAFYDNRILQGNATIDNVSSNVTVGGAAFTSNGSGGYTTITPVFLR